MKVIVDMVQDGWPAVTGVPEMWPTFSLLDNIF
jgi:hypothetical protein